MGHRFTPSRRRFLAGTAVGMSAFALSGVLNSANPAMAQPMGSGGAGMNVGRGMADMTGEPLGAGMNGYAVLKQQTSGLRMRQMARAFIFGDDADNRVVHVTADMGLMFESIHTEVLNRLAALFGDRYHEGNVLIGASHTHVAPGGTSGHVMVDLTVLGFRPVTFEATIAGIVKAIERADADYQPSNISVTRGLARDAGVNRSFQSFQLNPAADKAKFPQGVDPEGVTLHVYRSGREVGFINWFSIHPTTFGAEHTIIDGDNKGYAAWKAEHDNGVNHRTPESAPFVAAFSMATPGDVSPNMGLVPASGPGGENYAESARILGMKQLETTRNGRPIPIDGSGVSMLHKWVDMRNVEIDGKFTPDGQPHKTGPAILGAAFAASSQEDGGGEPALQFNEGERGGTPWVHALNKVVVPPSAKEIHGEKDLLLPVGYVDGLLQQVHMFSIANIGGLILINSGFEPTVMTGYRLRRHVAEVLGISIDRVICQGYTNSYGHYVTTPEEYAGQDYEGGATAFGKYLQCAFTQIFDELALAHRDGLPVEVGSKAGDLTGIIPSSPSGNPMIDLAPLGKSFGDVLEATEAVTAGSIASASFVFANPNSDLRHEDGYLLVKSQDGRIVADDYMPSTTVEFQKDNEVTNCHVTWETDGIAPGVYTIEVRGVSRDALGNLAPFTGETKVTVT